jgi:FlaA1/EpsC-like NDP-sugar epimerase
MDMAKIEEYLADRKVLITWARSDTNYMAVRFGNMLGSHGGVVPLFGKQISEDESVPVTSSDMTRFFTTVSKAVQLVIQIRGMGEAG